MQRKKFLKRKLYQRLIDSRCPKCEKKLAVWKRHSDSQEFIGCSEYPKCTYTPKKSEVDFLREELGVPIDWKYGIANRLIGVFEKCQSSKEKLYLLGVIYYLDTEDFDFGNIKYNGEEYDGLIFNRFYYCQKLGGACPTSLAIIPQVTFGKNFHHDFGIFFSKEKFPTQDEWKFGLAVEIDYHPKHEWSPETDRFRDSLVKYKVLRLKQGDNPQKWFRKVEVFYNSVDGSVEIDKELS
jgi:ssDNA-binding Zn-finger/Zn-ribbon topoisomerase 1